MGKKKPNKNTEIHVDENDPESLKDAGNKAFIEKDFDLAIWYYT